ncbi:dCTP deaminase domain-containing protein [Paraclostridium bifermentans]|uniref:dCTP deaminase domain-containing protein n=1 Tax=Paraclostridium bifermentans TaxID=1490 RepID=UPI00359C66A9
MGIKRCFNDTKEYFKGIEQDELEKKFQGWSYDLTLGPDSYITSDEYPKRLSDTDPYLIIKPGDFALLITDESLNLDNDTMAFISVKFTYKKQGLINISGFHVDPGYKNKIIFSVYNAGPSDIILKYKEPVFMIFFQELESECKACNDNSRIYNIDKCEESEKIKKQCKKGTRNGIEGYKDVPVSLISEIKGQSVTLADNHRKIEDLERQLKVYSNVFIGIMIPIIILLITLIAGE